MSLAVPPYPPARYTKDEPEVSAWLRSGTDPPDHDSFGVVKYHYLADQQATDGDYGLYRVDIAPNGGGPGPHFHRAMSEAFFVLSGTVKLYDGTHWIGGHPNDFLYVSARRHPRLSQRGRRADVDLDAVCSGRTTRALFRGLGPARRHVRRRAARVVHQERQLLHRLAIRGAATRDIGPRTCILQIRCARLLSDQ